MMSELMRRRSFITLLSGASVAWPLAARAQQPAKLPTIGYLGASGPAAANSWTAAFVQRLRELGWVEGRTVVIEYRWAEGRPQRYAEITAEFVRLKVDVIATYSSPAVLAAKQVTSTVPIVFSLAADPVGSGIVASLARPGGNVTGLSTQHTDFFSKRLELLRTVVPGLRQLAIMANPASPANLAEMAEVAMLAHNFGLDVVTAEISRMEDIVPAFDKFKGRADALYITPDSLTDANRVRINTLALTARLPTMFGYREYVDAGGLMSYGPNYPDLFRRTADHVDKILRGAKPADIPVEQPTKFELVVNLLTAKALGLTIPETFLVRADEVIE